MWVIGRLAYSAGYLKYPNNRVFGLLQGNFHLNAAMLVWCLVRLFKQRGESSTLDK